MGGLARRAALFRNVREARENTFVIDAGNLFGHRREADHRERDHRRRPEHRSRQREAGDGGEPSSASEPVCHTTGYLRDTLNGPDIRKRRVSR